MTTEQLLNSFRNDEALKVALEKMSDHAEVVRYNDTSVTFCVPNAYVYNAVEGSELHDVYDDDEHVLEVTLTKDDVKRIETCRRRLRDLNEEIGNMYHPLPKILAARSVDAYIAPRYKFMVDPGDKIDFPYVAVLHDSTWLELPSQYYTEVTYEVKLWPDVAAAILSLSSDG